MLRLGIPVFYSNIKVYSKYISVLWRLGLLDSGWPGLRDFESRSSSFKLPGIVLISYKLFEEKAILNHNSLVSWAEKEILSKYLYV